MVKWVIQIVRGFIFLLLLFAALTVGLLTIHGGSFSYEFILGPGPFRFSADGLAGENKFSLLERGFVLLLRFMVLAAIYQIWRLLGQFAKARYFSKAAVQSLYLYIGLGALTAVLQLGLKFARGIDATESAIGASLDKPFTTSLIFALALIVAHVLNEARKQNEELNDYF